MLADRLSYPDLICLPLVLSNTIKPVSLVNFIKQPPAFNGQYIIVPNVHVDSKWISIKQPPAFKGQFHFVPSTGC